MIFSTASFCLKSNTWKMALCSESTGSSTAPWRAISAMIRSPAQTRVSLLASATTAPRRTAASVASRPAAPTMADITQSAGRAPASATAVAPAATSTPVPLSAAFRSLYLPASPITAWRGRSRFACSASSGTLL